MWAAIQAASGKAKEEPIVDLPATATTQPVAVWAPTHAAGDLGDTPVP